jgi:outer membrane protein assembly factor BamB
MLIPDRRQRPGRISPMWAVACFVVFGLLTVIEFRSRPRAVADPTLAVDLERATLVEDPDPSEDWPQWRGPRRDGLSTEEDLLTTWPPEGPRVLWRAAAGEGYSSLAVAAGRVYTLFQDGDRETVVCWDADTGREQWRFPYPARYVNGFGSGPRATPTVDGDRVYTVGATGLFHCLDAATGKKLWEHDLLKECGAANLPWGVSFSPLVDGDLVFTNPGGPDGRSVAAFNKHNGKLVWQALDDPAGYSSPIAVTAAGVRQVVVFTGAGLVGMAPGDGKLFWRYPWETSYGVNAATPIFFRARSGERTHECLFISSGYGKGCALLEVMKGEGGAPEVKMVYENNRMRNHFSSSVRLGDHVYGLDDDRLTCMEVRTGQVAWQQRGLGKGALIAAGRHLIVLGEAGTLALVEAAPDAYHESARFDVFQGKCWTAPALAHGRLYLRDEKEVVCLDLRKKSP